jgi:hypothetical protein
MQSKKSKAQGEAIKVNPIYIMIYVNPKIDGSPLGEP